MDRQEHFKLAFADAPDGHVLEFGVGAGRSMLWLVRMVSPDQRLFGFDSFQGLPEDWEVNSTTIEPAGSFKYDPPKFNKVEYQVGWFEDTIPKWKKDNHGRIAFLHIDSDLYSSCKTILWWLNDRITPGTVIVVDDMYGTERYKYWEQGEYKAFNEWILGLNRKIYELGRGETGEVSFRVLR